MNTANVNPMDLDLRDAQTVIDTLTRAAALNRDNPRRHGSTVRLPNHGTLTVTGDLHDHTLNFQRVCKLAALKTDPDRFMIFQEVIHGDELMSGYDLSIRMLVRVAALTVHHGPRVIHLLSNHELAQLNGEGIMKDRADMVRAFEEGAGYIYHQRINDVLDAVADYIRSLPLAVRCANGLLIAHSLPGPRKLEAFDPAVLERPLTDADRAPRGAAHLMVWGRKHTDALTDALTAAWGAGVFVLGHQPAEMGYDTLGDRVLILNSDHDHGVGLPIDLSRSYDLDALTEAVVPLAAVTLP